MATPFIIKLTVDATNSVLAGTAITLPISGHSGLSVDWGIDGESMKHYNTGEDITLTVPSPDNIPNVGVPATVTITGIFTKFGSSTPITNWFPYYLKSIDEWGSAPIEDLSYACAEATNLESVPATLPSTVTNVSHMFNQVGASVGTNIVNWDVSGVTDFDFFLSEYGGMNDTTLSNVNSPFNKAAMKLYFSSGISTLPIVVIDGNIGIDWGDGNMTYANGSIPSAPQPVYPHVTVYVYGKFTTFGGNSNSPHTQFLVRVDSWGTNNTILSNLSYAFVGAGDLMTVPNTLPSTVTNVEGMFKNAYATSPPLYGVPTEYSSWNMANVTDLNFMFDSDYFDTSPMSSTMSPPDISSSTIFGQTITIATKKSMVYNFTIRKEDTLNYDSTRTWSQSPFYIDPMELVISGSSGFLGPLELPISGIVGNITVVWVEAGTGGVTNTIQASYVDLELVSFPSGPSIPSAEFTVRIFGYFTNFSVDIEPATSTVGWPGSQALLNMSAFGKNPNLTSLKGAFAFCNSMDAAPPSILPTSVTNLSYLCFKAISEVGIPAWNTTNVTDMAYAFAGSTINNSNAALWNISGITKYEKFAFFITNSDGIKDLSISSTGSPFRNRAMAITVLPSYVGAIQLSDIGTDGIAIDYNEGSGAQYVGQYGSVPDPFFTYRPVNGTIYIYGSFGHFGAPDLSGHQSAEYIIGISSWGTSNPNLTSLANAFNGGFNGGGTTSTYTNDQQTLTLPSLPSTVTNLSGMFANCPCDISGISLWDLSGVTDTSYMFYQAREGGIPGKSRFNSDIRLWNVSNVTEMSGMFNGAYKFVRNISTWNTGTSSTPLFFFSTLTNNPTFNENSSPSVTDTTTTDPYSPFSSVQPSMTLTFNNGVGSVTLPIEGNYTIDWGNGSLGVNDPSGTPVGPGPVKIRGTVTRFGNGPQSWTDANRLTIVARWGDVSGLVDLSGAFYGAMSLTQVPTTLPSTVTNLSYMFYGAMAFNSDISGWNTVAVTDMTGMFAGATIFNSDISGWNTGAVTNMRTMFAGAMNFNGDISGWNTGSVTNMSYMFQDAMVFNGDISGWNTGSVTNMSYMFQNATKFNRNISGWSTGSVKNMAGMFSGAVDFNRNLSTWNTEVVTDMANMFQDATAFNGDISGWNTGAVTNMSGMFGEAQAFNQDISGWNTGAVRNMESMFTDAVAFDRNLSTWNTAAVTDMSYMFKGATAFTADLSGWAYKLGPVVNYTDFFTRGTGGMTELDNPTIQSPRSPFYTGIPTPSNPYVPAAPLVVFDTPPNPTIKVGTEVFGTVGSVLYRLNPSYISIAVLSTGTFVGTLYRPYIANMSISNKIYGAHTGGKLFSYDTVTRTLDLSAGTYQGTPTGYMALDTNGNLYSTDSSGYIYKLAYATSTFVALNTTALLPPVIGPLSVVNDEFLYGADSENRIVRMSIPAIDVLRLVTINMAPTSLIVDLSGRPYYYDTSGYGLWALYPLAKLHDFSGNPLDGTQPVGPIRMDPTKRVLYGICAAGGRGLGTGFRGAGTLFSFDLSSSAYSVLVNYVAGDVNRGETPLNFSITTETGTAYVTTRSSSTTFQTRIVGPRVANGYAVGSAQLPGATTTCFNHGTKILSLINNIEAWIPVENLNIGDLVMTYLHGPRPITHIFKGVMINNPGVWHTCMYKGQREGFEPLLVTGGHGLLVDYLTEEEQAKQQKFWGRNEVVIDDKIVMIAPVSAEFTQITDRNIYTYYHFVVENDGDNDRRYGVYANGFLTETPSKNQAVVLKYKDHSVY